jgi:hypothetical protein
MLAQRGACPGGSLGQVSSFEEVGNGIAKAKSEGNTSRGRQSGNRLAAEGTSASEIGRRCRASVYRLLAG